MADELDALVPMIASASISNIQGGYTFVQLVGRLRESCGVSGSNPSSVQNLIGEMLRLKNYTNEAWMYIQALQDKWEFMKQSIEFTCKVGQQKYTSVEQLITSFGTYELDSFRAYPVDEPAGEFYLPFMTYKEFRDYYMFGANRTLQQRPNFFSISPQKDFLLGPTPDAQYRINGEGFARPTEMVNDSDRPVMPPQFHLLIVYRAMMFYGAYEGAQEVYQQGLTEYQKWMPLLCKDQLPTVTFGGPLA